jgi:hypothetical protein
MVVKAGKKGNQRSRATKEGREKRRKRAWVEVTIRSYLDTRIRQRVLRSATSNQLSSLYRLGAPPGLIAAKEGDSGDGQDGKASEDGDV